MAEADVGWSLLILVIQSPGFGGQRGMLDEVNVRTTGLASSEAHSTRMPILKGPARVGFRSPGKEECPEGWQGAD